ncbi:hypothetical protein FACS1894120_5160 [Clostridia bacterium]|nr:hypothetical protein FACS1894120_5160 [Clostridia bacterium]
MNSTKITWGDIKSLKWGDVCDLTLNEFYTYVRNARDNNTATAGQEKG